MRVVDLRELVCEWRSGPASTIVRWTLEPESDNVTRLHLSQRGFRPEDGWLHEVLKKGWSVRSGNVLSQMLTGL